MNAAAFAPIVAPAPPSDPAAHPVDRHVGLRIRTRRKALGISQDKLAEALGVTFQQVQKYERGSNRVSASKLWEVAQALQSPVAWFYEGLSDDGVLSLEGAGAHDFLLSTEGLELATCFPRIRSRTARRKIVELVRTLGDE